MNKQNLIDILNAADVDDSWEISLIDWNDDCDDGFISFINNEKEFIDEDGIACKEFDIVEVDFKTSNGEITNINRGNIVEQIFIPKYLRS